MIINEQYLVLVDDKKYLVEPTLFEDNEVRYKISDLFEYKFTLEVNAEGMWRLYNGIEKPDTGLINQIGEAIERVQL